MNEGTINISVRILFCIYEIVGIYLLLIRLGTIIIVAFFKLKKRYILRNIKACGII